MHRTYNPNDNHITWNSLVTVLAQVMETAPRSVVKPSQVSGRLGSFVIPTPTMRPATTIVPLE